MLPQTVYLSNLVILKLLVLFLTSTTHPLMYVTLMIIAKVKCSRLTASVSPVLKPFSSGWVVHRLRCSPKLTELPPLTSSVQDIFAQWGMVRIVAYWWYLLRSLPIKVLKDVSQGLLLHRDCFHAASHTMQIYSQSDIIGLL